MFLLTLIEVVSSLWSSDAAACMFKSRIRISSLRSLQRMVVRLTSVYSPESTLHTQWVCFSLTKLSVMLGYRKMGEENSVSQSGFLLRCTCGSATLQCAFPQDSLWNCFGREWAFMDSVVVVRESRVLGVPGSRAEQTKASREHENTATPEQMEGGNWRRRQPSC